jgi:hypothetical protein
MLIQRIQETITKAPEEEQDRDKCNGPDGLAQGKVCGFGHSIVGDFE